MSNNRLTPLIRRYYNDPISFVREIIRVEPEDEQIDILTSVNKYRMTTVKSGHGTGKTTSMAWLVLWFLFTRPFPKIPCTAPTMHQLRDILWAEISKWLYCSPLLKELLIWTNERVALKTYEDNWFAVARTATQPDAMQGFHADDLLFLIDEASGMPDPIFEPILGALTTERTKLCMVGNPTKTAGFFYNSFTKNAARFNRITLNAENSARVSKEFIQAIIDLYGKESDPYRVRVLGQFPKQQPDMFIALELLERAYARYTSVKKSDEDLFAIHLGVDVARQGDDESTIYSALEYNDGFYQARKERIIYKNTTTELTAAVKMIINDLNTIYPDYTVNVNVDGSGVGAGVVDELDSDHGDLRYIVNEWTFGGSGGTLVDEPIRYSNNTGLMWGNIRRLLINDKLAVEEDEELTAQITNRKYVVDDDGFILLERKRDMKKRGVSSPDRGDGLSLALATNIKPFSGMLDY